MGKFLSKLYSTTITMKIVFLDIDGVANCATTNQRHRGFIGIDPHMAFMIGKIQLETDCQFVLSSAWRHAPDGIEEVERCIAKMLDITPSLENTPEKQGIEIAHTLRGHEIKAWLDKHPEVTQYAIIDDNNDMLDEQQSNFFKTSWQTGITEDIMNKIIQHLK